MRRRWSKSAQGRVKDGHIAHEELATIHTQAAALAAKAPATAAADQGAYPRPLWVRSGPSSFGASRPSSRWRLRWRSRRAALGRRWRRPSGAISCREAMTLYYEGQTTYGGPDAHSIGSRVSATPAPRSPTHRLETVGNRSHRERTGSGIHEHPLPRGSIRNRHVDVDGS